MFINSQARIVKINDLKIWTESFGNPLDPAILLISGTAANAHFWPELFCNDLAGLGYYVIRYDHRDVGLSSSCNNSYTLTDLAQDALAILDDYKINNAHLIGHSMGGYIGQLIAANSPNRISSLIAISSGPIALAKELVKPPTNDEVAILRNTWEVLLANQPSKDIHTRLERQMKVWHYLNGEFPLDEPMAYIYTENSYKSSSKAAVHPHMLLMQDIINSLDKRLDLLKKIHTPILVIQGEKDAFMLPSQGGVALVHALPHAQLLLIAKMGHLLFNRDLIEILIEKISPFLKEHTHRTRI